MPPPGSVSLTCLKAFIFLSRAPGDTHLQAELVVAEVDEVLEAGHHSAVQVLPADPREDDAEVVRLQVVTEPVVQLVTVHRDLEHQQPQHHQVVLERSADRAVTQGQGRRFGRSFGGDATREITYDACLTLTLFDVLSADACSKQYSTVPILHFCLGSKEPTAKRAKPIKKQICLKDPLCPA